MWAKEFDNIQIEMKVHLDTYKVYLISGYL